MFLKDFPIFECFCTNTCVPGKKKTKTMCGIKISDWIFLPPAEPVGASDVT